MLVARERLWQAHEAPALKTQAFFSRLAKLHGAQPRTNKSCSPSVAKRFHNQALSLAKHLSMPFIHAFPQSLRSSVYALEAQPRLTFLLGQSAQCPCHALSLSCCPREVSACSVQTAERLSVLGLAQRWSSARWSLGCLMLKLKNINFRAIDDGYWDIVTWATVSFLGLPWEKLLVWVLL